VRLLDIIQDCQIIETTDRRVVFIADADIDCDGSGGNPDNDPYFQADTTLHYKGKALNAYEVPFVVVPPVVVKRTMGIVMGCHAFVTNLTTGKVTSAVVGDVGPSKKIGEISPACAEAIGVDPNPNTGGEAGFVVGYEILPGVAAGVNGVIYDLQPWKS
jgi:hypothetical protein